MARKRRQDQGERRAVSTKDKADHRGSLFKSRCCRSRRCTARCSVSRKSWSRSLPAMGWFSASCAHWALTWSCSPTTARWPTATPLRSFSGAKRLDPMPFGPAHADRSDVVKDIGQLGIDQRTNQPGEHLFDLRDPLDPGVHRSQQPLVSHFGGIDEPVLADAGSTYSASGNESDPCPGSEPRYLAPQEAATEDASRAPACR